MVRGIIVAFLLLLYSASVNGGQVQGWFTSPLWDCTIKNYDTGEEITGNFRNGGPYSDPWGDIASGRYPVSITLSDSGVPYFFLPKTDEICCLDTTTAEYSTLFTLENVREIEAANDAIYALAGSTLYKYTTSGMSYLCDIGGFDDIAVSPSGMVIGLKHSIASEEDGLYEIDPLTGYSQKLSGSFYSVDEGVIDISDGVSGYTAEGDLLVLNSFGSDSGDIRFSNDGRFWYRNETNIYEIMIDEAITSLLYRDSSLFMMQGIYDYFPAQGYDGVTMAYGSDNSFDIFVTPEPVSLLVLGGSGLVLVRRRRV